MPPPPPAAGGMNPMTTEPGVPKPSAHHRRTWWKAPFVASVAGLPLLAMEYAVIRAHDGMDQYGAVLYCALALLTTAWLLPRRRSTRTLRMVTSCLGLVCVLLPLTFALLLGAALAGS